MSGVAAPTDTRLKRFGVTDPVFVARTNLATIWRVIRPGDAPAALKVYHTADMEDEGAGFRLLQTLDGRGAARVFDLTQEDALIEWLDGPSPGDLTRGGDDAAATAILVDVANTLHAKPVTAELHLPDLSDWFAALADLRFAPDCPATAQTDMIRSQTLAHGLLDTQTDPRPLHGDLHHDNIRQGTRGFVAFDAKGVIGERTFELANAFRNPLGAEALQRDPSRIASLADHFSAGFGVDRTRLLQWAAAQCALSIAWRSGGTLTMDAEFDLLNILLDMSGTAP
jgi:streptomycin 6-kinase